MAGADADGALDPGGDDPEPPDLAALRVTREESRAVLDHQIALLNELDDRTMRTVRLAGFLLGLVLTVVGILGPTTVAAFGPLVIGSAGFGVCCLVGCVLVGVGTYSTSNASYGIDGSFRSDVVAGSYGEREWLCDLLTGYDEWTVKMQRVTERNGAYLLPAQFLLLAGFTLLVLAIALTAMATYL